MDRVILLGSDVFSHEGQRDHGYQQDKPSHRIRQKISHVQLPPGARPSGRLGLEQT
jgi:hypothetical protein